MDGILGGGAKVWFPRIRPFGKLELDMEEAEECVDADADANAGEEIR